MRRVNLAQPVRNVRAQLKVRLAVADPARYRERASDEMTVRLINLDCPPARVILDRAIREIGTRLIRGMATRER